MEITDRFIEFTNIVYDRERLEKLYEKVSKHAVDYSEIRKNATEGLFSSIKMEEFEGQDYLDYPEISELVALFNPIAKDIRSGNIAITVYKPGFQFHPHTDFSRKAVIMFPILPADGGRGVDYYDDAILGDDQEFIETDYARMAPGHNEEFYLGTHQYSPIHPTLMNAEKVHGVRNDDQTRVYLQFSLYDTFDVCVERVKSGEFFNEK